MMPTAIEPLRAALVGYGYAGRTFHAPLIAVEPGIDLVAVVSSRPEQVRADLPHCAVFDFATVLARRDIDLVVIATPNASHFALARDALIAGKHVVVDKPCTVTAAEAQELVQLAAERQRLFTAFHNRRWDGDFLTLKQLLGSGALGRIVSCESRFDRYRPVVRDRWRERAEPGAGTWFDLGPHLVDQSLVLFGPPAAVQGSLAIQREGALATDRFHVTLRHRGLEVLLSSSYFAAAPGPRFRVFGTQGSYVKQGVDPQEAALARGERPVGARWGMDPQQGTLVNAISGDALEERFIDGVAGNYPAFYRAVHAAIREAAPAPVSGTDIVNGMRILEAVIESSRTRQEIVLQG